MQYYNETMVNKLSYEMGRHLMLDFTLSYMTNTWVPPMEHVRPEKVMFHPKLTGLFDIEDGDVTNNYLEAWNAKMKKSLGSNPNLTKFLEILQKEESLINVAWRQRARATPKRALDVRFRLEKRKHWRRDVKARLDNGMDDDELIPALDDMVCINRHINRPKNRTQTFLRKKKGHDLTETFLYKPLEQTQLRYD